MASVFIIRSLNRNFSCPSRSHITTAMAAAARFFTRGANSKLSICASGTGIQSSFGAALLKQSPSCSSRSKTQRRHAAHFTFQPDPVPTQFGEWLPNRLLFAWLGQSNPTDPYFFQFLKFLSWNLISEMIMRVV